MFDLDSLLKAINAPAGEIAPTCVCGVAVRFYRDVCPDCIVAQRLADRRLRLGEAHRSLAGLPWAVWGGRWTKDASPVIVEAVRLWTRAKGNLILTGASGCGKTSGAVARSRVILSKAEKGGEPEDFRFACGIRFAAAVDLATARKQWQLGHGEPPEIETAIDATLLILDELGFEPQTDTAIPELADLRYRKNRLTITTSGLRESELIARYGEATVRKLTAMGRIIDGFSKQESK